jgi:hypothetical protein
VSQNHSILFLLQLVNLIGYCHLFHTSPAPWGLCIPLQKNFCGKFSSL